MSQFQPPQPQTGPMPPMQPYYPPPMQPLPPVQPPPKRPRGRLILAGAIALALVLVGLAIYISQAKTPVAQIATPTVDATLTAESNAVSTVDAATASAELTAEAMTPPAQPTVMTQASTGIGTTQSSGPWAITINSVSTSQGDQYDVPKAGDTFLLLNFTGKNTGSSNLDMSPVYFTLRDDQGNTYDIAYITVPHDPRGTVVAGQQIRGDLSYEVPNSIHQYILQFDSPTDFDNGQIVQWQLSV